MDQARHESQSTTRSAGVLFLSNYLPPEVNALANRTWEHARAWVEQGGEVEIVAGPPHFPEGRVYEGYENRLNRDRVEGVNVLRIPMYVTRNSGFFRRTVSYFSYMISAAWFARRARIDPGVVVASSPQFFVGLAGFWVSRCLRRPFVLEVRDLWPESIVAVGAMKRGVVVRMLERMEEFLYRAADHIVIVSPAFRAHIESCGVMSERITVVPNGVDMDWLEREVSSVEADALRRELGFEGNFVASYIGTIGMAHGLEVLLDAARRCPDPEVVFLVVGAGAQWKALHDAAKAEGLDNLRVVEKQPRDRIKLFYRLSDVSVVHLKDRPAFRRVIPSKMFESMAMRLPVVLGVRGQAREILEDAEAGIAIKPEDAAELLDAVLRLKRDPGLCKRLGEAGAAYVRAHYDRSDIARRYWVLLQKVAVGT